MANEILARVQLVWDFGVAVPLVNFDFSFRTDALAAGRHNKNIQSVGTGWEALETGDLAKQWMILKNLDTTNFISWGKSVADATELIRIPAGKAILIYITAAATAVKADTAICLLDIHGVEGNA